MQDTPLERRRLADIEAAIERAKAYAAAQEVPLTVERLAAEMEMDLERIHRILRGEVVAKSQGMKKKVAAICKAGGEATASVMEHALRRGSGANMHMLYLKNHAGYDNEKGGKSVHHEGGESIPPVIFLGEEDIPD
jgi:hypothetical protein